MQKTFCVVAILIVVIVLRPRTTLADHDMTCHPPTGTGGLSLPKLFAKFRPSFLNLKLIMPGADGATCTSCSGAGGEPLPVLLPPNSFSALELVPGAGEAGRYCYFEPVSQAFLDAHVCQSAELPNFTTPDGTPLLAQYNETGLDFLLQAARYFETGETLSVSGGQILAWPAVTLREMPTDFELDELFPPDPGRFPLYSGTAQWPTAPASALSPSQEP
jgi:hypothetical protein